MTILCQLSDSPGRSQWQCHPVLTSHLYRILPRWKLYEEQHTALRSILFSTLAGFDIQSPLSCQSGLSWEPFQHRLDRIVLSSSPVCIPRHGWSPSQTSFSLHLLSHVPVSAQCVNSVKARTSSRFTRHSHWCRHMEPRDEWGCPLFMAPASYGGGPFRLFTTRPLLTMSSLGLWWP